MKIIIELRNIDSEGNKVDNTKTLKEITKYASGYWNCEGIEVEK